MLSLIRVDSVMVSPHSNGNLRHSGMPAQTSVAASPVIPPALLLTLSTGLVSKPFGFSLIYSHSLHDSPFGIRTLSSNASNGRKVSLSFFYVEHGPQASGCHEEFRPFDILGYYPSLRCVICFVKAISRAHGVLYHSPRFPSGKRSQPCDFTMPGAGLAHP